MDVINGSFTDSYNGPQPSGSTGRGQDVANRLVVAGVRLEHLGLTTDGYPKHPLARGKHRIPDHQDPAPFVRAA